MAAQIRQSTRQTTLSIQAVSTNALQEIVSGAAAFNFEIARDRGLAEIVIKAFAGGLDALDVVDRLRFVTLYGAALENHQNAFSLHSQGLISTEQFESFSTGVSRLMLSPGGQQVWAERRLQYPEAFREFVDDAVARNAPAA